MVVVDFGWRLLAVVGLVVVRFIERERERERESK